MPLAFVGAQAPCHVTLLFTHWNWSTGIGYEQQIALIFAVAAIAAAAPVGCTSAAVAPAAPAASMEAASTEASATATEAAAASDAAAGTAEDVGEFLVYGY